MNESIKKALVVLLHYIDSKTEDKYRDAREYINLNKVFDSLKNDEKKVFLEILKNTCGENKRVHLGIVISLFDYKNTNLLMSYIAENLICGNYPLEELIALEEQLKHWFFLNQSLDRIYIRRIHDYIVGRVKQEIVFNTAFERDPQRIVILAKQLLGERHAPTRMIVNLYKFLQEIGYEVKVVVTNTNKIKPDISYWNVGSYKMVNTLLGETQFFSAIYYGIEINGYYSVPEKTEMEIEARKCIEMIRQYKPNVIFSCDGYNFVGDLLDEYVPVICMGFTKEVPVTSGRYIARYFNDGMTETEEMKKQLKSYQKIIPCIYTAYYTYETDKGDYIGKIPKKGWKVAIVGNRLDDEVCDEFEKLLEDVIELIPEVTFVFIGPSKRLKNKYQGSSHYCFIGYVEDLRGALSECVLFINPPRIGGAGGAFASISEGIPVITLPDCDVASFCGDDFTVSELNEYLKQIYRYYDESDFWIDMSKKAKLIAGEKRKDPKESIKNIGECIDCVLTDFDNSSNHYVS